MKETRKSEVFLQTLLSLVYLYLFLTGIKLLGVSLKGLGKGFAESLIQTTANPLVGLFIGIISTAIIQSSSATTSLVVGFVASGTFPLSHAIPVIMGANIGTTITNTLVSLAHLSWREEFRKAFSGAIVHDIFNFLTVIVIFPLQIRFHILTKVSYYLTISFQHLGGFTFTSPLKVIVSPSVKFFLFLLRYHFISGIILSFILVVASLIFLVRIIRRVSGKKLELLLDRYLFVNPLIIGILGFAITGFIQSSSVATSLVVPLVGAGLLSVEKIFPYTLGANVGTTLTAILASLVTGDFTSIQVAFSHLAFNILGILIWYPIRKVPIGLAYKLGEVVGRKRWVVLVYILGIFFFLPGLIILFFRR